MSFDVFLLVSPSVSQLANPDSVEGLVLINIDTNARGWIDWAAQKVRLYTETCGILIQLVLMRLLHQFKFSCGYEIMRLCAWSVSQSGIDYVIVYHIKVTK